MKKRMLFIGSLVVCGILVFNACTTTDLTAPVITLTGSGAVSQNLNVAYSDAGATAKDDKDGNITSSIVVTGLPVNVTLCGETIIHYNVSDKAGNAATEVTRNVKIQSDLLAGIYDVTETKKSIFF